MLAFSFSPMAMITIIAIIFPVIICLRLIYNLFFHPLAKYDGPWYARASSLPVAVASILEFEPQWLTRVVQKYGTDSPIRISPSLLLFPKPSSLKGIYWDPQCNQKGVLYGTGTTGPRNLFSTLDGDVHRKRRKAIGGQPWTIGYLKNNWEAPLDDLVRLFIQKMSERAKARDTVRLAERVAEFAADTITLTAFTDPWGFVKNSRDERRILGSWRAGLPLFGVAARSTTFRKILSIPGVGSRYLPKVTDEDGMGYLMNWADKTIAKRENEMKAGLTMKQPDFLQHGLTARIDGEPMSKVQKIAHVTMLLQAGADTTGTALGSTLRFLAIHPVYKERVWGEIQAAETAAKLSSPISYEETREHLPFFCACIKEALRLNPPSPNLFSRVVPKGGKVIDGHFVPEGMEITSNPYIVQRSWDLYSPDPDHFRPERWLESKEKVALLEAHNTSFGMGPRVCLGKDLAQMELHKLLPEIIRRFELEVVSAGDYVVVGGVGYIDKFEVKLVLRDTVAGINAE